MSIKKNILVSLLFAESRLILAKYKPSKNSVTGSVGKTATKDAVYDLLKSFNLSVRRSEKSMNSEIGLPLTVIGAPNAWYSLVSWLRNIWLGMKLIISYADYPKYLVLEVGADHPGDIAKITKWLHPDISIITKVSRTPVHVEFFKSPEDVLAEKSNLVKAVKRGGSLVLFADDDRVLNLQDLVKDKDIRVITFGINEKAVVRGSFKQIMYKNNKPTGFEFDLNIDGQSFPISVKRVLGETFMYPLLASAAVGLAKGFNSSDIAKALPSYEAPKGRMNILEGLNDSVLIDDSYNSSPDAVESALSTVKSLQCAGNKIAVLGDMMELGKYSSAEHRRIGSLLPGIVSALVTVGPRSRLTAEEAVKYGLATDNVHSFNSSNEAGEFLRSIVKTGDIVLVKGSQSMRMERVSKALLKEVEKASKLLVRQEEEWLRKV